MNHQVSLQVVSNGETGHDAEMGGPSHMPVQPKAEQKLRTMLAFFPWMSFSAFLCSLAGAAIGTWLLFGAYGSRNTAM